MVSEQELKRYAYKKENMVSISVRLSRKRDADLIRIYAQIPDKADFLRDAIRRYAEEHNIKAEE